MSSFRVRPIFNVETELDMEEIVQKIEAINHSSQPHSRLHIHVFDERIKLQLPEEGSHYWSPELEMHFSKTEDLTHIKGRYGPHPNVWTLFMVLYLAIAISSLFILIIGFARLSLGLSSRILWLLPLLIGSYIVLYIVSQLGQKLGADETFTIHHFVEELFQKKVQLE